MQSNPGNLFACYNCGSHNIIGVKSCGNCRATLYYNCPHCHAWVDNTFVNCPGCGKLLYWPAAGTYIEDTYITNKSRSPAVLLIACSVLLLIITFALVENSTNSVKAGSNLPAFETLQSTSSNDLQDTGTPYKQTPYSPSSSADVSGYIHTVSGLSTTQDTSSTPDTAITPASAEGSTYVPKASSYLNSVYPGWGRCSGGRCSGMIP